MGHFASLAQRAALIHESYGGESDKVLVRVGNAPISKTTYALLDAVLAYAISVNGQLAAVSISRDNVWSTFKRI